MRELIDERSRPLAPGRRDDDRREGHVDAGEATDRVEQRIGRGDALEQRTDALVGGIGERGRGERVGEVVAGDDDHRLRARPRAPPVARRGEARRATTRCGRSSCRGSRRDRGARASRRGSSRSGRDRGNAARAPLPSRRGLAPGPAGHRLGCGAFVPSSATAPIARVARPRRRRSQSVRRRPASRRARGIGAGTLGAQPPAR